MDGRRTEHRKVPGNRIRLTGQLVRALPLTCGNRVSDRLCGTDVAHAGPGCRTMYLGLSPGLGVVAEDGGIVRVDVVAADDVGRDRGQKSLCLDAPAEGSFLLLAVGVTPSGEPSPVASVLVDPPDDGASTPRVDAWLMSAMCRRDLPGRLYRVLTWASVVAACLIDWIGIVRRPAGQLGLRYPPVTWATTS